MSTNSTLPVNEEFYTFQGEGLYMGVAAYFVRLHGCPIHCPWCDSAGTWHRDYIPKDVRRCLPGDIAERASKTGAQIVVVTGGEPTIHDLSVLAEAIHEKGMRAHLETSGAFPILGRFDFITVSPKWAKEPLDYNVYSAGELKLIVEDETSVGKWVLALGKSIRQGMPIWLHPEWSQKSNPKVIDAIITAVKEGGNMFRAGCQLHKYYNVDAKDPGSRLLVPLGGNPQLGF